MAKLVSKVYGDALFEAARDCGKMDEIFEEVQSIGVILEENAELQKILGNPRVMREDKEQMIETIFRGRVSNEIVELMKLAALLEDFPPEADLIHLANGTLFLDGTFTEGKPDIVRCRLPVAYNPDAPTPTRWLAFLDGLLYPEDIPTLM